jgi:hypothetical protein
MVDGDLPTARLIDRCDSPASHRSQTSALSNSDNRTITNLLDENPILTERDATTP